MRPWRVERSCLGPSPRISRSWKKIQGTLAIKSSCCPGLCGWDQIPSLQPPTNQWQGTWKLQRPNEALQASRPERAQAVCWLSLWLVARQMCFQISKCGKEVQTAVWGLQSPGGSALALPGRPAVGSQDAQRRAAAGGWAGLGSDSGHPPAGSRGGSPGTSLPQSEDGRCCPGGRKGLDRRTGLGLQWEGPSLATRRRLRQPGLRPWET